MAVRGRHAGQKTEARLQQPLRRGPRLVRRRPLTLPQLKMVPTLLSMQIGGGENCTGCCSLLFGDVAHMFVAAQIRGNPLPPSLVFGTLALGSLRVATSLRCGS